MKPPVAMNNFVGSPTMLQQNQNPHFINNSMQAPSSNFQNPSFTGYNQSYSNPNYSMTNVPNKQYVPNNSFTANQQPPQSFNNQYNPNNYPKNFPQQNFYI